MQLEVLLGLSLGGAVGYLIGDVRGHVRGHRLASEIWEKSYGIMATAYSKAYTDLNVQVQRVEKLLESSQDIAEPICSDTNVNAEAPTPSKQTKKTYYAANREKILRQKREIYLKKKK